MYDSLQISYISETIEYRAEHETFQDNEEDIDHIIQGIGSKRSKMMAPSSPLEYEVKPLKQIKSEDKILVSNLKTQKSSIRKKIVKKPKKKETGQGKPRV